MYWNVQRQVLATLDDRLAASARMVAELMSAPGFAQMPSINLKAAERQGAQAGGVACEVSVVNGNALSGPVARTPGSPSIANTPEEGFSTQRYQGVLWRTYVLKSHNLRIVTSDRISTRNGLLHQIAIAAVVPFLIALLGSLCVVWIGVAKGLAPLEAIRRVLDKRSPDDARPLQFNSVPVELAPLVQTIQQLLERVRRVVHQERRFTDDAAHELRTPLAAVKVHLQVVKLALALKPTTPEGAAEVLRAANSAELGVQRMQHVLDHLLALARIDAKDAPEISAWRCDAGQAITYAMEDIAIALGRERVVVDLRGHPLRQIALPEGLLVMALRNLLDNALRYAPNPSPVVIRVENFDADHLLFTVSDEGPGLPEADVKKATQRFWRGKTSEVGSGLGLSIVASIADHFDGQFTLSPRAEGRGLEAKLRVRAANALPADLT